MVPVFSVSSTSPLPPPAHLPRRSNPNTGFVNLLMNPKYYCPRCGTPLPEQSEADAKPLQVLLVEDNPVEAAFAQGVIRKCNFHCEVHVASDGEEALQFLRREGPYAQVPRPDVILLDLILPKIDGWQVLNEIREAPELNAIPVAIVTGTIAEEDQMRAQGLRCEHYVTKPLKIGDVHEIVRAINA